MDPQEIESDKNDNDPPVVLGAVVEALNDLKRALPDSQEDLQRRMEGGGYRVLLAQIQPAIRELHTTAERAEQALPADSLTRASKLLAFATQTLSASTPILEADSDEKAVFALHNTVGDIAAVLTILDFEALESQALKQDKLACPPTMSLNTWAALTDKKKRIVQALKPGETLSAQAIAHKAGYKADAHFHEYLRDLQTARILLKEGREGEWFLLQAPPDESH